MTTTIEPLRRAKIGQRLEAFRQTPSWERLCRRLERAAQEAINRRIPPDEEAQYADLHALMALVCPLCTEYGYIEGDDGPVRDCTHDEEFEG